MLVDLEAWAAREFLAATRVRWPGIYIISGQRSRARQAEVNPATPDSDHTACPSLAADVRVGSVPTGYGPNAALDWLGARWIQVGGKWGGTFLNPASGQPDRNHFAVYR